MTIFVDGEFTNHSAKLLSFKIECDNLTDDDLNCLAKYYVTGLNDRAIHSEIVGVSRGGLTLCSSYQEASQITRKR